MAAIVLSTAHAQSAAPSPACLLVAPTSADNRARGERWAADWVEKVRTAVDAGRAADINFGIFVLLPSPPRHDTLPALTFRATRSISTPVSALI